MAVDVFFLHLPKYNDRYSANTNYKTIYASLLPIRPCLTLHMTIYGTYGFYEVTCPKLNSTMISFGIEPLTLERVISQLHTHTVCLLVHHVGISRPLFSPLLHQRARTYVQDNNLSLLFSTVQKSTPCRIEACLQTAGT